MTLIDYRMPERWSFGKIASQFETHIRRSIPSYDRGHEIIIKILEHDISPLKKRTKCAYLHESSRCLFGLNDQKLDYLSCGSIIDLGSSEGTLTRKIALTYPDFFVLGIDIEPNMIAHSIQDPELKNLKFKCADLLTEEFLPYSSLAKAIIAYYTRGNKLRKSEKSQVRKQIVSNS